MQSALLVCFETIYSARADAHYLSLLTLTIDV